MGKHQELCRKGCFLSEMQKLGLRLCRKGCFLSKMQN